MRNLNPELVKSFIKKGRRIELKKKERLFDCGDRLYLVLRGRLTAWQYSSISDETRIYGRSLVGDIANVDLISGAIPLENRELIADTEVVAVSVSTHDFKESILPGLSTTAVEDVFRSASQTVVWQSDLRYYNKKSAYLSVMYFLTDLAVNSDEAMIVPNGVCIKITHQKIGEAIGLSREMVGRVIKTLDHQGIVIRNGMLLIIPFIENSTSNARVTYG